MEKLTRYKRQIFDEDINYSNEIFEYFIKSYKLIEKTFNIGKDVDYIYNKGFKKVINDFKINGTLPPVTGRDTLYAKLHTSELKSKDSILANKLFPVNILCGVFSQGSYYKLKKGEEIIVISINKDAILNYHNQHNMSSGTIKSINNEITEHKMKATIYHELSHWVSDALHNSYLHNLIARAGEHPDKANEIMAMGKANVNSTHFEIDAQIHAIKQIKRNFRKEWDNMTLTDLFYKYTSLMHIAKSLYSRGTKLYYMWIKDLIKRMQREGLLGKNMKNFPSDRELSESSIDSMFRV